MPADVVTFGGGIQSTAIAALIIQGRLPKPKHMVMADTGRERQAVWDYLDEVTNPALAAIGLKVERIDPNKYIRVGLSKGKTNSSILMPVYTENGKLPTFCSTEWKQSPVRRFLWDKWGYGPANPVRMWFGMSLEEVGRMRKANVKWIENWYPLILNPDTKMSRQGCIDVVRDMGWPKAVRSACWMCPHRDDKTWQEIKDNEPEDFAKAVELEREIRDGLPWGEIWLHKQRVPLDEVEFDSNKAELPLDLCADACWT